MTSESEQNTELARLAFKPPPVWKDNVEMWILQIESQFIVAGIKDEKTKFHSVVASLDGDILTYVSDIVKNPSATTPYSDLKKRLIQRFSESESAKLRTLMSDLELGDKKPSQLLHEMKVLAGDKFTDDALKILWLKNLPLRMQQILSASTDSLDGLSKIADKIAEVSGTFQSVNAVSSTTDNNRIANLETQVAALTSSIEKLTSNFGRARSFHKRFYRRKQSQSRSRSRTRNKYELCWYHYKFGRNAKKCNQPCNFSEN